MRSNGSSSKIGDAKPKFLKRGIYDKQLIFIKEIERRVDLLAVVVFVSFLSSFSGSPTNDNLYQGIAKVYIQYLKGKEFGKRREE